MFQYIRYHKAFDALYKKLDGLIAGGAFQGKYVVMFGTSNIAGIIIYYLRIHGIETDAIIDNDKTRAGTVVYGTKVFTPQDCLSEYRSDAIILLASIFQEEMAKQLENFGYRRGEQIAVVLDMRRELEDYSYADRSGYTELSPQEVRESQLRILTNLDVVCRENGLRYYICGGTLLGAVRHRGYIPWDDDIDVVMPFTDIKRLSGLLGKDGDFSLISCFDSTLAHYDTISFLTDNTVVCDCNNEFPQMTTGLTVDLFPFIGVPDDAAEQTEYLRKMKELDMLKWNSMYDSAEVKRAFGNQLDYMLQFDYDSYELIGNVLSRYFVKDIFPREWFEQTVRLPFESVTLTAPHNYDGYLKKLYGDYMQLPPVEKQVGEHHYKAYWARTDQAE